MSETFLEPTGDRRFADAGDVRLAYQEHGTSGPHITLVHGGLVGLPSWHFQLPVLTKQNLARGNRLLAFDQRGYGASTCPAGRPPTISTLADDLVRLWHVLGIERTIVVGFSMGGFVALEAAVRAPERVAGIVLESSAEPSDAVRSSFAQRADDLFAGQAGEEVARHARNAFSQAFADLQPEVIAEYSALAGKVDPHALASTFTSISTWRLTAEMRRLDVSTLIVSGSQDKAFGPTRGRELRDRLRSARHVVVPGSGHTVHCEKAPGFNHLITEFCDTVDSPR